MTDLAAAGQSCTEVHGVMTSENRTASRQCRADTGRIHAAGGFLDPHRSVRQGRTSRGRRDPVLSLAPMRRMTTRWAFCALVLHVVASTGCMTVTFYQPQRAIHRPVVIEHSPTNFAGLRILVRCLSHDDYLPAGDAAKLCGKIAEDFEKQGAETEWVAPVGATYVEPMVFDGQRPDLTVEIGSKIDHAYGYPLTTVTSCLTCTVVPGVSEQTFSQRVVVYGRDRSVLTEEVFRERFVEYHGCGVWSLNWIIDWVFREDDQAISGDAGKKDFTRDFYGQIRQLTFNARVRSEVLGLTTAPARKPFVDEGRVPTAGAPGSSAAPSTETPTSTTATPAGAGSTTDTPSAAPASPASTTTTTTGASAPDEIGSGFSGDPAED
jgi:hypothetical protein